MVTLIISSLVIPATTTSVQISDGGATPTAGQSYTLTCSVSGASITIYQWRKNGMVLPETGPTLSFSPFRLSDTGQYICVVTVNNMTLTDVENVVIMSKISKLLHCALYTHSFCCVL